MPGHTVFNKNKSLLDLAQVFYYNTCMFIIPIMNDFFVMTGMRGFMTHKGVPDYQRASRQLLKDYVTVSDRQVYLLYQ